MGDKHTAYGWGAPGPWATKTMKSFGVALKVTTGITPNSIKPSSSILFRLIILYGLQKILKISKWSLAEKKVPHPL